MKKLTIKELAPYLMHGLQFQCIDLESEEYEILPFTAIYLSDGFEGIQVGNQRVDIDDLFANEYECLYPILRPLSDLTKEIEVNGEKFVPLKRIESLFNINELWVGWEELTVENSLRIELPYDVWQKLFEWHFDIFSLIENGLAIDVNSIN